MSLASHFDQILETYTMQKKEGFFLQLYQAINQGINSELKQFISSWLRNYDQKVIDLDTIKKFIAILAVIQLKSPSLLEGQNIHKFLSKIRKERGFPDNHLISAYIILGEYLVGTQLSQSSVANLLSMEGFFLCDPVHDPVLSLPSCDKLAEISLLYTLLDNYYPSQKLYKKIEKWISWLNLMTDNCGMSYASLYCQEKDYNPYLTLLKGSLVGILFQSSDSNSFSQRIAWKQMIISKKRFLQVFDDEVLFLAILVKWILSQKRFSSIDNIIDDENNELELSPLLIQEPTFPLLGARRANTNFIWTFRGCQTGLGSISYKKIKLTNFGPQYGPLGDHKNFGIDNHNSIHLSENSFNLSHNEESSHFKGFIRLLHRENVEKISWSEIEMDRIEDTYFISMRPLRFKGAQPLSFVFYFQAGKCLVNGKVSMSPATLKKFEGEIQSVSFQTEEDRFKLTCDAQPLEGEVIPLSCDNHFWGAHFLVAFKFPSNGSKIKWVLEPV